MWNYHLPIRWLLENYYYQKIKLKVEAQKYVIYSINEVHDMSCYIPISIPIPIPIAIWSLEA